MFSTEPILWLQGHLAPLAGDALWLVSQLGSARAYVALVLLLGFGLRLRPALGVLIALLLAGIATDALKGTLALPRPSDVDARIAAERTPAPAAVVARGGALDFWATLPSATIAAARAQPRDGYGRDGRHGFPSGHVATAVAATAGFCWFFSARSLLPLAVIWPLLMALSRMTLGRHFLADVLGGLAVGAVVTTLAALLWPREPAATTTHPRAAEPSSPAGRGRLAILAGLAVLLAVAALGWSGIDPKNPGRLLGVVAVATWLQLSPRSPASIRTRRRLVAIGAAGTAYVLLERGSGHLLATLDAAWSDPAALAGAAVVTAGTLAAGALAARAPS